MRFASWLIGAAPFLLASQKAVAAEDGGHFDLYQMALAGLGIDHTWVPTAGALFVLAVITALGLLYKRTAEGDAGSAPDGKFGLRFVVESALGIAFGIARDNCGTHAKKYFPLLAGIFLFILVSNLSGMIPGLPPTTASMDTNVAIGLLVFVVYNLAGIRESGAGYIKHFLGPVWAIAPFFFCIELVSHGARPFSLGLRLMGNLFADHTLLGVFTKLTYVGFPALLMFFGLIVAIVQSFVFTLLSGIYVSMAMAHDH